MVTVGAGAIPLDRLFRVPSGEGNRAAIGGNEGRIECPELDFDLTNPMNECPAEEIANSELGDKLAGWPAWIQDLEYPS